MITKFNQFINESLLDKMKGKDEDVVLNNILKENPTPLELLLKSISINLNIGIDKAIELEPTLGDIYKYMKEKYIMSPIQLLTMFTLNNNTEFLECILKNYNYEQEEINSALERSCTKSNVETITILINNGADINYHNSNGFRTASFFDRYDVIKLLIENGVNINAKSGTHDSALSYAIQEQHFDIVKLLIENGANITDFDLAKAEHYNYQVLQYLKNKVKNDN